MTRSSRTLRSPFRSLGEVTISFLMIVALLVVGADQARSAGRQLLYSYGTAASDGSSGSRDLFLMDEDGSNVVQLTAEPGDDYNGVWSPDGSRIAFASDRDGDYEIYVMAADGGGVIQITDSPAKDFNPAWSPDGTEIAFRSQRTGNDDIWRIGVDGSGLTQLTTHSGFDATGSTGSWSWITGEIAFSSNRAGNLQDVFVMDADGGNVRQLTNLPGADTAPAWSPDGTKLVFVSDRHGQYDIFAMNADGTGQTRLTTDPGQDVTPSWSHDGTSIAFSSDRDGDFELFVMEIDGTNQTQITFDTVITRWPAWTPPTTPSVAVCPSGALAAWEGDGLADETGSFPLTVYGGATFAGGLLGNAFSVDGSGDYLEV
ncbi:PD40 domain-containing protein, partial [bacterium]|nr:PD40 domain-containing protein [bacterium]